MKKLFIFYFLMIAPMAASACDICGCGAGNYYFGIMPQFHKQFVGLRYRFQSFNSHVGLAQALLSSEQFQTIEIWSRFYPLKRLQVVSFIPYHINEQTEGGVTHYLHGLGDIPILVSYNLINTVEEPLRKTNHNLWIGGGIKLPTGKYNYSDNPTEVANPNFQLGTGSLDWMVNAMYTLRHNNFGWTTDVTIKINTANQNDYQFGNRISGTSSLFYVQQWKKIGLMPNAGMYYEASEQNFTKGSYILETGGTASFTSLGLELYYKKISMGMNWQTPVAQNLGAGRIQSHNKTLLHVTFMF
jgi:hypothetical protein